MVSLSFLLGLESSLENESRTTSLLTGYLAELHKKSERKMSNQNEPGLFIFWKSHYTWIFNIFEAIVLYVL